VLYIHIYILTDNLYVVYSKFDIDEHSFSIQLLSEFFICFILLT
jgi:hypothetical protein